VDGEGNAARPTPARRPRLLDQERAKLRLKHASIRTETVQCLCAPFARPSGAEIVKRQENRRCSIKTRSPNTRREAKDGFGSIMAGFVPPFLFLEG